jgi:uncharacterized protein YxjI
MKHFYIKQKVFAFTDRYKVFDEKQNVVYHVESKLFSLSHRMNFFRDADNTHLFVLRRQILALLPRYFVTTPLGEDVATIQKRFTVLKHKLDISSTLGNFTMTGDFLAHDFAVESGGRTVLEFHKKWISWGDSYEITIHDETNTEFLLALVLLIDDCLHDENRRH